MDSHSPGRDVLAGLLHQPSPHADGEEVPDASPMPPPHTGERLSMRRAARLLLAGRSYQAVQAWVLGEPIPAVTAEFLIENLQRVDAREGDRTIRVADDEIAIIVKR